MWDQPYANHAGGHRQNGTVASTPLNPRHAAALDYAARGLPIVPVWWAGEDGACGCGRPDCASPGKHPHGPSAAHGGKDATTDPATIAAWWHAEPRLNLALSAVGLLIVDVDGEAGERTLVGLIRRHGPLPLHPVALTGRIGGGRHLYFRAPPGRRVKNIAGRLTGLDFRGAGGQAVAPPSYHASGRPYEWAEGLSLDDIDPPPAPDWLVELACEPIRAPRPPAEPRRPIDLGEHRAARWAAVALEREAETLARTAKGGRNHALNAAAFNLGQLGAAGHLDRDACETALMEACERNGLIADGGRVEFRRTFESGWTSAAEEPRDPPERPAPPRAAGQKRGGAAEPEPDGAASPEAVVAVPFSEDALALRFTARHAADLRYVAGWSRWLRWDGTRWRTDDTLMVFDLARAVCREAAVLAESKKLGEAKVVAAVERLAKSDRRHAATVDQWDGAPWLITTHTRAIEMEKDLAVRPHRREDYATKLAGTAYDPDALCPTWNAFIERVTDDDAELQAYLARVAGYCLTGLTVEHVLFFLYGTGANGKSVFVNTLAGIWGDYHTTAPMETFLASSSDRHPTELAALRGARLVTATETQEGRRWDEAKIKALTGGDRISARFMRQDFFEFTPAFKLLISGNHKPSLRNVDVAVRRRIHLIPFTVTIPEEERDQDLTTKLQPEWPGILRWAVDGCLEWQRIGLAPPRAVTEATDEYFKTEDMLQTWIGECCTVGGSGETASGTLWASWKKWAFENNEREGSRKGFTQNLEARGFTSRHTRTGSVVSGLSVRPETLGDTGGSARAAGPDR